ncbi:hypothetical protein [Thioclava atlantica]|uniref:Flp pilus assembly protein, pilin Flp n=1 Tax=Thioclava atlantica TaxID=1317124 RepID=A0A085TY32_9RHOB|nr:hypothetical protein [Thioclava atlantica]KFE35629.1 hypothetical protein DW2_06693 [Thioclava atlantica]
MKSIILNRLRGLSEEEDGAVTVDWVVLTAAIVSLGMLVGGVIWTQTGGVSKKVADYIGSQTVTTGFGSGSSD